MDSSPGRFMRIGEGGSGGKVPDHAKNFGVLFTGYLDKKQPTYTHTRYKRRFVVLTQDAVHWFKRDEGYDLFGEERGQISLCNIENVRILDEATDQFELRSGGTCRYFKAASQTSCEEWVSAIKSAKTAFANHDKCHERKQRRQTLSNIRNFFVDPEDDNENNTNKHVAVTVLLVSLKSPSTDSEIVLARNPIWDRMIKIPNMQKTQELILFTSNGGMISLSSSILEEKAYDGESFDAHITGVPLASSLRIRVEIEESGSGKGIYRYVMCYKY
jgi:hypothetical protein